MRRMHYTYLIVIGVSVLQRMLAVLVRQSIVVDCTVISTTTVNIAIWILIIIPRFAFLSRVTHYRTLTLTWIIGEPGIYIACNIVDIQVIAHAILMMVRLHCLGLVFWYNATTLHWMLLLLLFLLLLFEVFKVQQIPLNLSSKRVYQVQLIKSFIHFLKHHQKLLSFIQFAIVTYQ